MVGEGNHEDDLTEQLIPAGFSHGVAEKDLCCRIRVLVHSVLGVFSRLSVSVAAFGDETCSGQASRNQVL